MLSTLCLDLRLSLFTGFVAAAALLLAAAYVPASAAAPGTPIGTPPFYLAKAIVFVLAGLAAAFVAEEIRRRVIGVLRSLEERRRVVAPSASRCPPRSSTSC